MTRSCQRESFAAARPGIEALMPEHHREFGDPRFPPKPLWAFFETLEKMGKLITLTVRDDGVLIGFALGGLHRHINSCDHTIGTVSTYYVADLPGRVFIEKAMLEDMLRRLAAAGAEQVRVDIKADRQAARLLEVMGGKAIGITYEMPLAAPQQESVHA